MSKVLVEQYIEANQEEFRILTEDNYCIENEATLGAQAIKSQTKLVLIPSLILKIRKYRKGGYVSCFNNHMHIYV